MKARLRWLLWGAARPERSPRGGFLLGYGLASWLFSLVFLIMTLTAIFQFSGRRWGLLGGALGALLGFVTLRGLLRGLFGGEVRTMILRRHKRTAVWLLLLGTAPVVLYLVRIEDRANGPFQVRPAIRAELRAPVAGFLQEVSCDEGDRIS